MLLHITLLLIISLLIYITISTLLYKEVKYIVVTQIKTGTLKRKEPIPSFEGVE